MTVRDVAARLFKYICRGAAGEIRCPCEARIRFATKADQEKLRTMFEGRGFIDRDIGTAWIDLQAMQVVRLERHFRNLPAKFSSYTNTVDYAPVRIGDREFWLPKTVRADVIERDPKKTASYVAEYSECKKFSVSVEIKPGRY